MVKGKKSGGGGGGGGEEGGVKEVRKKGAGKN